MADKITLKQKRFAEEYLETGNRTRAALEVYDTEDINTAAVIGSENLRKPKVIEYLESQAELVAKNMAKLAISAESEQVQVAAGKDVLDRAGYKPVDRSEVKSQIAVNALTDEEKTKLIALLNDQGSSQ